MKTNKFNLANRLIHWALAFTFLFILLTVFLRTGWMNKGSMGNIIQENLSQSGITISKEDAAKIGKEVRRPMWQYHVIAGYVLIGLYVIRIAITIRQGVGFANPFAPDSSTKEKFKSWIYILFYGLVCVSLFTGFMVVNGPKNLKDAMETVHVQSLYYAITFIALHIGGVLIAEISSEKGIVSNMISGSKK